MPIITTNHAIPYTKTENQKNKMYFNPLKYTRLYSYIRNFCNLISLEQWYFSLIWKPTSENYKPFAGRDIWHKYH